MAPVPVPEVIWNDRNVVTGSGVFLVSLADAGELPSDSRAWRTSAVESGSVDPGALAELGS